MKYELTDLTQADVQLILNALGKLPLEVSFNLVHKVLDQTAAQEAAKSEEAVQ
jgi:hypothetical protein